MNQINDIILRYFYLGNSKYAPGTVSSFFILLVWFFIPNILVIQLPILFFHLLIGFYFCYLFSIKKSADKDPSFIVIDEVVGMMISLYFLPKDLNAYLLAFILFRIFDIFKPSIINRAQNLPYGVGIMMDDIISGILSLLIVMGLFY